MQNLDSLSIAELESICDQDIVRLYRRFHKEPEQYREAILNFLNQPKLPFADWFAVIRNLDKPSDAWQAILEICKKSAPAAPWNLLPAPDLKHDIDSAKSWLGTELKKQPHSTGIYLGLDTLNMRNKEGMNVTIGGTEKCDPAQNSKAWLESELTYGKTHLILGLLEFQNEYSKPAWRITNKKVPLGDYYSFADYALFLTYSGIILGHALKDLEVISTSLITWGFHDGDLFLLGRKTPTEFSFVCE